MALHIKRTSESNKRTKSKADAFVKKELQVLLNIIQNVGLANATMFCDDVYCTVKAGKVILLKLKLDSINSVSIERISDMFISAFLQFYNISRVDDIISIKHPSSPKATHCAVIKCKAISVIEIREDSEGTLYIVITADNSQISFRLAEKNIKFPSYIILRELLPYLLQYLMNVSKQPDVAADVGFFDIS